MRKNFLLFSLAMCAMLLASSVALAADNWIGTWKLNLEKSKYIPGPAPKSQTLKYEDTPDGVKFASDGVDAEGKTTHAEFVSKFDGKEVPYTGNPNADTAAPKKVTASTYENPWKKDGKPTMTTHAVVSKDGKTLTIHHKGKNAKGETVNNTLVFEKE